MSANRGPCRRVLVIDDSSDLLESVQMALEDLGHQVDACQSGAKALDHVNASGGHELVLCDLGLSDMDGAVLSVRLRELLPEAHIWLLTGSSDRIGRGGSLGRTADGVLLKPFGLPELERLLAALPRRVGRFPP